jgi:anti-sigma-K factor RskA
MRFAVAAGLALLVATSVFLYSELQNQNRKIAGMQLQINESKGKIIEGRNQLALYKDQLTLARSTAVKQIILTGTPKHADATAIVYWNTENKNVYITASNLPAPPETHDYQLWAIVDGKPTDMGVIRFNEAASMIIAAGNVSTAQAFAITLETKGGNPSPNLDQLYVIAQI